MTADEVGGPEYRIQYLSFIVDAPCTFAYHRFLGLFFFERTVSHRRQELFYEVRLEGDALLSSRELADRRAMGWLIRVCVCCNLFRFD